MGSMIVGTATALFLLLLMKGESASRGPEGDPIAAAVQAMAEAMADAQQAMSAASTEKSHARVALAEAHEERTSLRAEVLQLQQVVQHQKHEIRLVCARSDDLATERDIQCAHAEARARRIAALQERLAFVESSRRGERTNLDTERADLEIGRAALKADQARLRRDQRKLAKDKRATRSAMAGFKRTVEALENEFAHESGDEDSSNDVDAEEGGPSARKRQKTEDASGNQETQGEYTTRHGRRVPKPVYNAKSP
ncbi:hypothetical protein B0H13DRAFT_2283559 [Mycena leptocephala]|nr:hypothetical protein B0H13DRAFT_2283559 [Mycena leptocephala]